MLIKTKILFRRKYRWFINNRFNKFIQLSLRGWYSMINRTQLLPSKPQSNFGVQIRSYDKKQNKKRSKREIHSFHLPRDPFSTYLTITETYRASLSIDSPTTSLPLKYLHRVCAKGEHACEHVYESLKPIPTPPFIHASLLQPNFLFELY